MNKLLFFVAKFYSIGSIKLFGAYSQVRSFLVRKDLERFGNEIGPGFVLKGDASISFARGGKIKIGKDFVLEKNARLYVMPGALLDIGDRVFIGHGSVVAVTSEIRIDSDTQIAHNVTLMDRDHNFKKLSSEDEKRLVVGSIHVGKEVWIGANATILKRVSIGAGSVVGAGAVVTKSVPPAHVAVGNPAVAHAIEK